jgi:acyl-CoA synthetase (AMP-forming)/AMP-acid ligase II/acyl carrier protein
MMRHNIMRGGGWCVWLGASSMKADVRTRCMESEGAGACDALASETLPQLLRRRAIQQPDRLAFNVVVDSQFRESRLTYKQLDERACAVVSHLHSAGLSRGRIALVLPTGVDFLAAFYGVLYCGGTAVPLSPPRAANSAERLRAVFEDAGVDGIITTEAIRTKLAGSGSRVRLPDVQKCILMQDVPTSCKAGYFEPAALHDVAVLQYTSGSTSAPKGVEISHGNFMSNASMMARASNLSAESIGVNWLPLFHDMGLMGGVIQPVFMGFPINLLSPTTFLARPVLWLRAMTVYKATVSGAPDFSYNLCTEAVSEEQIASLDLRNWRVAYSGAEPVRAQTLERFAQRFSTCGFDRRSFFPCYGLAEATLIVSGGPERNGPVTMDVSRQALERRSLAALPAVAGDAVRLVASGRPVDGQTVLIVDPAALTIRREAEVGEIWIRGASTGRGYWNKPEASKETFDAHLAGGSEAFLRTGDLGFLFEGNLFVTGRIKDLIIIRGANYYPQDIETTVEQCHGNLRLGGCAAFSVETAKKDHLVVVCELRRDSQADAHAILRDIQRNIIEQHGLSADAIVLVAQGALPRTTSGKIQRHLVRRIFLSGEFAVVAKLQLVGVDTVSAADDTGIVECQDGGGGDSSESAAVELAMPIEKLLIAIWSEVLKVEPIGVESNFFELGGDSAKLIRAQILLSEALKREVPITLLFQYPSIRMLAGCLSGTEGGDWLHQSKLRGQVRRGSVSRRRSVRSTETAFDN